MKNYYIILVSSVFILFGINLHAGTPLDLDDYRILSEGLENIIVEKYYIADEKDIANKDGGSLLSGAVTYRVFVDLKPDFRIYAVYGIKGYELRFETSTHFFNNTDRGDYDPAKIPDIYLKNNTVMLDSWVSMGRASSTKYGVLKIDDKDGTTVNKDGLLKNTDPNMGVPLTIADGLTVPTDTIRGLVANGDIDTKLSAAFGTSNDQKVFSTVNGFYSNVYGSKGVNRDNRILIGQFTTNGQFSFNLNIACRISDSLAFNLGYINKEQIGQNNSIIVNFVHTIDSTNAGYISSLRGFNTNDGGTYKKNSLTYKGSINTYPIVNITKPIDNTSVKLNQVVEIECTASDADGSIAKVEFFKNEIKIAEDLTSPFQCTWAVDSLVTAVIKAVATDNEGNKTTSTPVNLLVDATNIENTPHQKNGFDLSPNPVKDAILLTLGTDLQNKSLTISIYRATGTMVYQKQVSKATNSEIMNLSELQSGLYFIELTTDNIRYTNRLIKQ